MDDSPSVGFICQRVHINKLSHGWTSQSKKWQWWWGICFVADVIIGTSFQHVTIYDVFELIKYDGASQNMSELPMFLNPSDARGHLRAEHGLALRLGNTRWVYIEIHLEWRKGFFCCGMFAHTLHAKCSHTLWWTSVLHTRQYTHWNLLTCLKSSIASWVQTFARISKCIHAYNWAHKYLLLYILRS